MRLTAHQTQANQQLAPQVSRAQTRVRVNGSRLDDSARGGEVDLMLELPAPVDNPARMAARMSARVSRAMRGRKVNVLMIEPARFIRDTVRAEPCRSTALRDTLINLIPLMVRQAHHERNQKVTVHPEPGACRTVEGFKQRSLRRGAGRTGIRVNSCRSNSAPNPKSLPIHNIAFKEGQLL